MSSKNFIVQNGIEVLGAEVKADTATTANISSTPTTSTTVNIATGATASGQTTSVNIGTNAAAGSTTNVVVGSTGGNSSTTLNGTTTVTGNLIVSGTTVSINSTNQTLKDPIITLGEGTISDDNKDRGIEFKYYDAITPKTGFFGWDDSTQKFILIQDGSNTNEVFTATTKGVLDLQRVDAVTFASSQATGTAPFTVASTTKVTNLNADLLDGFNTSVSGDVNTIPVRGATIGNTQVTGLSTTWGVTSGINTGGINVVQGVTSSATWLISGTSGGIFRGGIQTIDTGTASRYYTGSSYFDFNATTSTLNATNITGSLSGATDLPISTGVSGLGTGVATFLTTPSSANLIAAVTDETGTGALVFGTSPTLNSPSLVTPALGTPATGNFSTGVFTWPTFNQSTTGSAATLTTARTIAIGTGATGTATSFNGSANITIPITSIDAGYLLTGTVPDGRISGSYTGMTNLTGTGNVDFAKFLGNAADLVTTPSFSWTTDTTTGIYRPAASQVAVTIAGTQRGLFSAIGLGVTGTITATSFNSITALSSTLPAALGTATIGTSTTVARSDHVHVMPTLDSLSNTTITSNTTGEILTWNGSAWINNTLAEAGIQPTGSYATLTGSEELTNKTLATGATLIAGAKISLGTITSTSTASPDAISLGATFSSTAGANPKLRIYDSGTTILGFGVSNTQLDYIVPTSFTHNFYVNAVKVFGVSSTTGTGNFNNTTTTPTGTTRLNWDGYFYPTFLNLIGSADTATAATNYYVETGSDGFVRPKTLANVKTEIVTTAAVNSAAATTVGTVTTGTWNATAIAVNKGGTGATATTGTGNNVLSASPTFTGTLTAAHLYAVGSGNAYNTCSLEAVGSGSVTAYPAIGFHQPALYGSTLQVRSDGNFSFYNQAGALGTVTAATFTGTAASIAGFNNPTTVATASTIVYRDTSADINVRLIRSNYADEASMSGGIMYRINNSDNNYNRVCTSPSAVRTWLGTDASTGTRNPIVNYSNDSNSTYQMIWGSGQAIYGTAGITCNPAINTIYATTFSGALSGNAATVTAGFSRTDAAAYQVGWIADSGSKTQLYGCAAVTITSSTGTLSATYLYASQNVTAYSDERVKTNWRSVGDTFIDNLASLKSGVYDRTDCELTQVGVGAQSLQKFMPHAVLTNEKGELSVAYGHAAMVSAVELAKEVVSLKSTINSQQEMINRLIERLDRLTE